MSSAKLYQNTAKVIANSSVDIQVAATLALSRIISFDEFCSLHVLGSFPVAGREATTKRVLSDSAAAIRKIEKVLADPEITRRQKKDLSNLIERAKVNNAAIYNRFILGEWGSAA